MKNIISVGEVLMDVYSDGNEDKAQVGGASFNVACCLGAIKNNKSFFLGCLGNDKYKAEILKFVKKYNICDALITQSELSTTIARVSLDENKERNFEFIRHSDADLQIEWERLESIGKIDFIHFGSATAFLPGKLKVSYKQLFDYALQHKIPFSFDPNFRDKLWVSKSDIKDFIEYCQPYLAQADLIKVSEDELFLLTNEKDQHVAIRKIANKNPHALICVSRGSNDTLFVWKNLICYIPVIPCENIQDTTGAGDSFISKLIDEYVNNDINNNTNIDTIARIIHNANLFAAKNVNYLGALTFLEHLQDK